MLTTRSGLFFHFKEAETCDCQGKNLFYGGLFLMEWAASKVKAASSHIHFGCQYCLGALTWIVQAR